ncbi:hypothetical protein X777_00739 [Ooceraea biroi]|uniref:Tc1-like transposase DDE domain-containing protein n=1 Tax=Ooceraea biroi TaxID=2015173 RepID=A0A026WRD4_OOCBI|nr:hypothetical protein X777_00739 [Ooceraea biroi]
MNTDHYLGVPNRTWNRILRVWPEYREQGSWVVSAHNAPAHKSKIVRDFLARRSITVLKHPSYSLPVTSTFPPFILKTSLRTFDYYLFRSLQNNLNGKKFVSFEDLKNHISAFFDDKSNHIHILY